MPRISDYYVNLQEISFDDNKMTLGFGMAVNYLSDFKRLQNLSLKNCGLDDKCLLLLGEKVIFNSKSL